MYRSLKSRLSAALFSLNAVSAYEVFMNLTEHKPFRSLRTLLVPMGDGSVALRRIPTGDMLLDLFMGIDCPDDSM